MHKYYTLILIAFTSFFNPIGQLPFTTALNTSLIYQTAAQIYKKATLNQAALSFTLPLKKKKRKAPKKEQDLSLVHDASSVLNSCFRKTRPSFNARRFYPTKRAIEQSLGRKALLFALFFSIFS